MQRPRWKVETKVWSLAGIGMCAYKTFGLGWLQQVISTMNQAKCKKQGDHGHVSPVKMHGFLAFNRSCRTWPDPAPAPAQRSVACQQASTTARHRHTHPCERASLSGALRSKKRSMHDRGTLLLPSTMRDQRFFVSAWRVKATRTLLEHAGPPGTIVKFGSF